MNDKYQISTINENGKYVGLVTKNGEVYHKTEPQSTPTEASRLMTKFIREATPASKPLTPAPLTNSSTAVQQPQQSTSAVASPQPPPRKCCGRR
jgi:hypothetical protein